MMYKFVNKKAKIIMFVIDIIGFMLWILCNVFRPGNIINKRPVPLTPKKILLIRIDYIGDVLLTTHTLKAIRQRFPESHITFLVSSKSCEILEGNPYIDEILIYNPPWFFKQNVGNAIKEYFNIRSIIKKKDFDLAADFRGDVRNILLLMVFGGIPNRVSFASSGGWYLLTTIADYGNNLHEARYHSLIAERLGAKIDENDLPALYIENKERIIVKNFLEKNGLKKEDTLVIIHPGARKAVRQWPLDRYAIVGKYLIDEYGAKIILTGTSDEIPLLTRINNLMNGKALIASGEIKSLKQLTILFENCKLFVGISSAPSHLAGIARLPSVLIFGPETIAQWEPIGNEHIIIHKNFSCCPCDQKRCPLEENNCINAVETSDVICAITEILKPKVKETLLHADSRSINYGCDKKILNRNHFVI